MNELSSFSQLEQVGTQTPMISRDEVAACYRAFLGREPESERVIDNKIEQYARLEDLLVDFINSEEFNRVKTGTLGYAQGVASVFHNNNNDVEYDVSTQEFDLLLKRAASQWTLIGQSEPHWGVLSDERFLQKNIKFQLNEFYNTGFEQITLVKEFFRRNKAEIPTGNCMELGCGVGRVTHALASHFQNVIAFDISNPMLDIARKAMPELGRQNCSFYLLKEPQDLITHGLYDFFFSVIVLQHNPPPVMKRILQLALQNIRDGGGFFFQVPTYQENYSFRAEAYLNHNQTKEGQFEMHALPMHVALNVIREAGCRIVEVVADNWTGLPGSHTFFGVK